MKAFPKFGQIALVLILVGNLILCSTQFPKSVFAQNIFLVPSTESLTTNVSHQAPNGTITIVKQVVDNDNSSANPPDPQDFQITLNVNNSAFSETFDGPPSPGKIFSFHPGSNYVVQEEGNIPPGLKIVTTFSTQCNSVIVSNVNKRCVVTNTFNGLKEQLIPTEEALVTSPSSTGNITGNQTLTPITESLAVVQPGGGEGTTDPPFGICRARESKFKGSEDGTVKETTFIPSSATYTIRGEASLSRAVGDGTGSITASGSNNDNQNEVVFEIVNDLVLGDDALSANSDPPYKGRIIDGILPMGSNVADFKIQKISTECRFYALAEPIGQNVRDKVAPIGEVEPPSEINRANPAKNELLYNGQSNSKALKDPTNIVSDNTKVILSSLNINPPVRKCSDTIGFAPNTGDPASGVNFAKYIIRGTPELSELGDIQGRHTYALILSADIQTVAPDTVKIVNNNNQQIKAVLVKDPGKDDAVGIEFPIQEISTACLGLGFSDSNVISENEILN